MVVPLPGAVGLRDAAPLVMSGDRALGFGRISSDRRSAVLDTRGSVGVAATLRVVWSGGGVPAPRGEGAERGEGRGHRTVQLAGAALNTPVYTGPSAGDSYGSVPHALVMAVPVPLGSFGGVDLTKLEYVSVVALGNSGDITVGDVSFQK
jgi:hypothetical protein